MAIAGRPEGSSYGNAAGRAVPPPGIAWPRRGFTPGAFSRAGNPHGTAPVMVHARAKTPDLRGALLPGAGTRAEAEKTAAAAGYSLRNQCRGSRRATPGASLPSHESAKTGPGRNSRRYAVAGTDAPPAAGRCGIGQDHRPPKSHAGGHRKRLPDGPHGAYRNPGYPTLPGSAQAAGAVPAA